MLPFYVARGVAHLRDQIVEDLKRSVMLIHEDGEGGKRLTGPWYVFRLNSHNTVTKMMKMPSTAET